MPRLLPHHGLPDPLLRPSVVPSG